MTLRQVLVQVQQDIVTNLNDFIRASQLDGEDWFTELTFHNEAPRVGMDKFFMGIYLSSPDGEVYTGNALQGAVGITLDCMLDDVREHSYHAELYLSAVIDFLKRRIYGISSNVTTAVVLRADLDVPYNGFAVAISATVYDMDKDI